MGSLVNWVSMAILSFLAAGTLDNYIDEKKKSNSSNFWSWTYLFCFFICIIPAIGYMLT